MCRERRAAHADDARFLNPFFQFFPVGVFPVRIRFEARAPLVCAVGENLDGRNRHAVCAGDFNGIPDFSAGRRVKRNGNKAVRLGDALPLPDLIAFLDDQFRRRTDVLMDRERIFFQQRRNAQRLVRGEFLALVLRMNSASEFFRMNG